MAENKDTGESVNAVEEGIKTLTECAEDYANEALASVVREHSAARDLH